MGREHEFDVQVGPYVYCVSITQDAFARLKAREQGNESVYGEVDYRRQIITIDPDLGADQLRETLFHELMHTVVHLASLRQNEAWISRVSPLLLDILCRPENEKLRFFLLGDLWRKRKPRGKN